MQGKKALADLIEENPEYGKVEIEWIEENEHPEIIANYDYYATPSMFIDGEKKYEASRATRSAEVTSRMCWMRHCGNNGFMLYSTNFSSRKKQQLIYEVAVLFI